MEVRVTHHLFNRVFACQAIAAKQLNRSTGHCKGILGHKSISGHRGQNMSTVWTIVVVEYTMAQCTTRFHLAPHIKQAQTNTLGLNQQTTALFTFMNILQCLLKGARATPVKVAPISMLPKVREPRKLGIELA